MAGSALLTGANGSAGLYAAEHLLKTYPELTAILTVRSTAGKDVNTSNLRRVIAKYPNAKVLLHELDLGDLTAVNRFTTTLKTDIKTGKYPPLKTIICNAFYWNLIAAPELTIDGFDKTFQVNVLANVAVVLRLLDSFSPDGGRINLISSVAHYRRKNPLSPYVADIPANLDELVHPPDDPNRQGHGVLRYGNSKLVLTTWTYALNRYLEQVRSCQAFAAAPL
jgi:NAD(P)-dependent dehydrogenase (short-subunit alcohol dehydrogenase family)